MILFTILSRFRKDEFVELLPFRWCSLFHNSVSIDFSKLMKEDLTVAICYLLDYDGDMVILKILVKCVCFLRVLL